MRATIHGVIGVVAALAIGISFQSNAVIVARAQTAAAAQVPPVGGLESALGTERSGEAFTLTFFNRPIVVFRARVLGRGPAERGVGARRILDDLAANNVTGPVEAAAVDGGSLIRINSRVVFAVWPPDVDDLAGETLAGVTDQTVANLRQALAEANEARTPGLLVRAIALASLALLVASLLLWGIARIRKSVTDRLQAVSERRITQAGVADLEVLRASRLLDFERGLVTAVLVAVNFTVLYATLTFVLREFPYTRPWGESMSTFLLITVENLALGMANAIPGLFAVLLIFLITRFLVRLLGIWFGAIEKGRARSRWIFPETAQPTRRLLTTLLWLFAVVVAYPYLPGSGSDAFKGVSVFLGLMLTFGSSGLVNQIVSGFMVTYSRALRSGDYVRIGDVEGTVIHLGILSVKLRTFRGEEATIPNAVVVGQTTTDYSRFADTGEVFTPTSVTIGYDAPWRQVHALLLLAAERTPGVRRQPKPYVLQEALQDFYVKYTLFVCLENQEQRYFTLNTLHAQIQDLFNEHGVQIMSPNYLGDPAAPKVVARKNWYAAPAASDESVGASR